MNQPETPPEVIFQGGLSWARARTPRVLSRIGKALFALAALNALALVLPSAPWLVGGSLIGAVGWLLFPISYVLSLTHTSFAGALTASANELVVSSKSGQRVIPGAEIAGALVVDREVAGGMVPTVEIQLKNGDRLTARMGDPQAPRAVVRALGFGPGGKRVRTSVAKPTRRLLHPLLGFACYTAALTVLMLFASAFRDSRAFEMAMAGYPPLTLLLYTLLQRYVRAPDVTVGDDGILVKGAGAPRFIARRDIAFAGTGPTGVLAIEERTGRRTPIVGVLYDKPRVAALSRVIAERYGPSAASADRHVHYERGGRPLAEWRDHLARALHDTNYRENAASADEAASVLYSAFATPEQRVGAALALRVAGQPRERIRVAADGAADDRVREALEAVADAEDDAVIEKALKRLQT